MCVDIYEKVMHMIPQLTIEQRKSVMEEILLLDENRGAKQPEVIHYVGKSPSLIVETMVDGVTMRFPIELLIQAFVECPVGMSIQSGANRTLTANKAFAAIAGLSVKDLIKGNVSSRELTTCGGNAVLQSMTTLSSNKIENNIALIHTAHGERYVMLNTVTLAAEREKYCLQTVQDIHDLKVMERQIQEANTRLKRRIDERTRDFQLATDLAARTSQKQPMVELLPEVAENIKEAFALYHVAVFLYDKSEQNLMYAAGSGSEASLLDKHTVSIDDQGLVPMAARHQKTIVINDVTQPSEYCEHSALLGVKAEMVVPLVFGSDLLGVLLLNSETLNYFTPQEKSVFETFGEQLAITIYNGLLFTELREARRLAEEANVIKSSFLAHMSHELRTPLNAIMNFSAFVENEVFGLINDRQKDAMDQVRVNSEHLLSLINDVLDISKIEAGKMGLFVQEVDLNELLPDLIHTCEGLLVGKPIKLMSDITSNLPITFGDKRRIQQIVMNILSNAIKFTEHGSITLKVSQNSGQIDINVADTGIGIPPEGHYSIFEPFTQARKLIRGTGGTGLGLPITKYFVESHGGHIWFESTLGQGSSFYVSLPILTLEQAKKLSLES